MNGNLLLFSQQVYSIYDRELLAIYMEIYHFQNYREGHETRRNITWCNAFSRWNYKKDINMSFSNGINIDTSTWAKQLYISLYKIDDVSLCFNNDGSRTRRVNPNQNLRTTVDLSLFCPSLASQLSWSVLPSTHGGDHYPILISIYNRPC